MAIKIINVCGARPNFMKIAPLMAAYKAYAQIEPLLVHTGQHYDRQMSELFFNQLGIPEADINLGVGSGSHAGQTAAIMERFEPVVLDHRPDYVLVVGDVNSTIACALTATKLGVGVIHVEAGLRSFDRTMPEEINRVLTDAISDLLFVTEQSGVVNLRNEGIDEMKIRFVGNVMIDTLVRHREQADRSNILDTLNLEKGAYGFVTLHRPANVDNREKLSGIIEALGEISCEVPLIFSLHPRTRKNIDRFGLHDLLETYPGLRTHEPFGYLECLKLMSAAAVVLTDSGGMQEETTILGVPCLTLRENTERPATITEGTNRLAPPEKAALLQAWSAVRRNPPAGDRRPKRWDGHAGDRIAEIIAEERTTDTSADIVKLE